LSACVVVCAQQAPPAAGDELFLSPNDIPRALRVAPRLAAATNQGKKEAHAYLATEELSYQQISQIFMNVSVAYTAVKLEEYLKQLEPLADEKGKDSQYAQYIAQAKKQLAELTEKYQRTRKNGRSALEINKEFVVKNQPAVEELMVHIRNMKVESLPKQ